MHHTEIVFLLIAVLYIISHYVIADEPTSGAADDLCYCLENRLSKLRNPVHIAATTRDKDKIYLIAEQIGSILEYNPSAKNKLSTYLNLSHVVLCKPDTFEERGLLGFALHPNFTGNGKLYTYSIRKLKYMDSKEYAVVSEITGRDLNSEKILLTIEQPGSRRNGGQLLFGVDGYLYVFVGDGEPVNDDPTQNEAQNTHSLLGKILRIDVDHYTVQDSKPQSYSIPADNPKLAGWRPEIYALGIRNMWRCGMDSSGDSIGTGKGRIFCGDLGNNIAEEINFIVGGGNYGWPYKEGDECLNKTVCGGDKSIDNEQRPIYTFNNTSGMSAIVGGPVYRGKQFTHLAGRILVGDFMSGSLFTLQETKAAGSTSTWSASNFSLCPQASCACDARAKPMKYLLSFGDTNKGEVFVLMTANITPSEPTGALLELVPPLSKPVTCGASWIVTSYTVLTATIYSSIALLLSSFE